MEILKLMDTVITATGDSAIKIPEIVTLVFIVLCVVFLVAFIKIYQSDIKAETETKSEHYQRIIAKYIRIIAGVLMVTAFLGVLAAIVYISVLL